MPTAPELVNKLLEADPDAPEQYVDWLHKKEELGPLDKIRCGAHIYTSDEQVIRENAAEHGANVDDPAFWEAIERDMAIIEANCLQILRESGLFVQDEGHGNYGDRVASVWIDPAAYTKMTREKQIELAKALINWAEGDSPSTSIGNMDSAFGENATQKIYKGTSEIAGFIDVSIEFTGTNALVEWLKLNLTEGKRLPPEDEPEAFIRTYVPRMMGRLLIEFHVIKPNFPDAPNNWYRENADGMDLFRYNKATEMREVMRQMKAYNRQRSGQAGIDMVTYRYKVPNPSGSSIVQRWLDKIGCPPPIIQWACETNPPIWFYTQVKEFNAYMKMVYPQVKLDESEDVDCARRAWADYKQNGGQLVTIGAEGFWGEHAMVLRDGRYHDQYTPEGVINFLESPYFGFVKEHNMVLDWKATPMTEEQFREFWAGQISEGVDPPPEDDPSPEHYLQAVTGWIDTFLKAGFEADRMSGHEGQFWKRYELRGWHYMVVVGTRVPRYIIVERVDSLYGRNVFRRVFEFPDRAINGLVTQFKALDRLLTKARTSATENWHVVDTEIDDMYNQHKRWRDRWLSGKVKEGIDDPGDAKHYLNKVSPESCFACSADLTQPNTVIRTYISKRDEPDITLEGHYDPDSIYFVPDQRCDFSLLSSYDLPDNCDTCKQCGESTYKYGSVRNESDDNIDPKADTLRLMAHAPLRYDELKKWRPHIHHDYQCFYAVFIVPVFTATGRLSRANSWLGWTRMKQFTYEHPPTWEQQVEAVRKLLPDKLPGFYPEKLKKRGFQIGEPYNPYEEKLYVNQVAEALDPDDPGVNIERHIASMDPAKILEPLGFSERWPSWKCADPEYKWWERYTGGLKWTVIRKSDDEPHIFEVSISKSRKIPGHPLHDYEPVGGFNCHIGDLDTKLREALAKPNLWRPAQEALGVPDPDQPEPNIERFAQHVEKTEMDALDSAIDMAVKEFETRVRLRDNQGWTVGIKEADQLAAEVGDQFASMAGFANGSDEYDMVVSAVNNRASEMFPSPMDEAADPDDPQQFIQHMETDWRAILSRHGWKPLQHHGNQLFYELVYPDRVWVHHPVRVYAHHGWNPEQEFVYDHPGDPEDPAYEQAEDAAYAQWQQEHPPSQHDVNFPDHIAFQFGIETYRRIEVPITNLDTFCSRFVREAKKVVGTETVASVHQGRGLTEMLWELAQQIARDLKIPLRESLDDPTPEFIQASFDVPAILKRMGYEKSGSAEEWFKVFRKAPEKLDLMIEVKRRGLGGEANEGDIVYDITVYCDPLNPNKQWSPIAYRYKRNNAQLERVLKILEAHVHADDWQSIKAVDTEEPVEEALPVDPVPPDDDIDPKAYAMDLPQRMANYVRCASPEEAQQRAIEAYQKAKGRVFKVTYLMAWRGNDTVEIHGDFVIRVLATDVEDDILRWHEQYLDPVWEVEVLDGPPEDMALLADTRSHYIDATSYTVTGHIPEAVALPPEDEPELVIPQHAQSVTDDPEAPVAIKSHTHGAARRELESLGFTYSTVAMKYKIFGEPEVPSFWSKRYPGSFGHVLFIRLYAHEGTPATFRAPETPAVAAQLNFRTRYMPNEGIQVMPRNMAQLVAVIKELDTAMQQSAEAHWKQAQEQQALEAVAQKHVQWSQTESLPVDPLPPEDDPEAVIKSHEKGLVVPELKSLGFHNRREKGVETLYGEEIPRWWYKAYQAPNGSNHGLYVYLWGGQTPEVQTNNYDFTIMKWYQPAEIQDRKPQSPAQSQAHLSAIIHDLDAAMQRSTAVNLPPDQEHEIIKRIMKHHRKWWDDTLDYVVKQGGIRGRIGPGEPA